jgi:flagellar protein FlgJ
MEISAAYSVYAGSAAVPLSGRERVPEETESFSRMLERAEQSENGGPASLEGRASRRPQVDKSSKLYESCQELETFLLKTLVKGMRDTIQKSNLIDTGFAGEVYEDMLYDEYTKDFARNARLGLAETAYLELTGQRGVILENRVSVEG